MPPTNTLRPARSRATRIFWGVARVVALAWLLPALLFNVDWTGHGSWQANSAAVVMILGSALFIEGTVRLRSLLLRTFCAAAAIFLVYVNTKAAVRNLSLSSEVASEAKAARVAGGSHLASQRSHPGCEDVTVDRSGKFCGRVAAARGKIEAAVARDKIDAELDKLPAPTVVEAPNAEAPVVDAYVANVIALLKEAGFNPSERLVKAEEAMARALGFELLAALGPSCWLAFINVLAGVGHAPARPRPAPKLAQPIVGVGNKSEAPALPDDADDLDRCIGDVLEDAAAGMMKAKEIRPLVEAWFSTRNKPKPTEAELWAKMGQRFQRDPNNGRPRYLGLKPRAKGPPKLAVVAGSK